MKLQYDPPLVDTMGNSEIFLDMEVSLLQEV